MDNNTCLYEEIKVSIITPSFNSKKTLLNTYQSILAQTHKNWEWIIVDDFSTDSTREILTEIYLNERDRVKVFYNEKNLGAAASRNYALQHVQGDFIAFIDSDDKWMPQKLQKQIAFMNLDLKINFCFTAFELIDSKDKKLGKIIDLQGDGYSFSYEDMLKKKATLGCSTVMLRNNVFKDLLMPIIVAGEDYALWLKLLKTDNKAYLLSDVLAQYRILPGSLSRNKFKKSKKQWQVYRNIEKLSFFNSLNCFTSYAWRAVVRR
ncbi:glycosyltransferase family 2 protein [Buttiauxella sp. B2]|uniref:glycosyltransferase family 2 protein n=1 Tax=Buttiauxella sp. B2 TaxID=2587812 RepID=UPI001124AC6C|nr:glycosyltransferase [Buttiauxella sp. B2]TNV21260.1 glycosyltransferase family 2 protein [Buttiauxella sp. B2]